MVAHGRHRVDGHGVLKGFIQQDGVPMIGRLPGLVGSLISTVFGLPGRLMGWVMVALLIIFGRVDCQVDPNLFQGVHVKATLDWHSPPQLLSLDPGLMLRSMQQAVSQQFSSPGSAETPGITSARPSADRSATELASAPQARFTVQSIWQGLSQKCHIQFAALPPYPTNAPLRAPMPQPYDPWSKAPVSNPGAPLFSKAKSTEDDRYKLAYVNKR
jgi:hypothetical protein